MVVATVVKILSNNMVVIKIIVIIKVIMVLVISSSIMEEMPDMATPITNNITIMLDTINIEHNISFLGERVKDGFSKSYQLTIKISFFIIND